MGFTDAVTRMYGRIYANGDDAAWRVGGVGTPVTVKVMVRLPDEIVGLGSQANVKQRSSIFEVRVSEAPTLAAGDTLTWNGQTFRVAQPSRSDMRRLIWRVQATVVS